MLSQQIAALEDRLKEIQPAQPVPDEPSKAPRKLSRADYKLGILGAIEADSVVAIDDPVAARQHQEALAEGKPLHIDNLVIRFGGDRSLKARLCQLGERWETV